MCVFVCVCFVLLATELHCTLVSLLVSVALRAHAQVRPVSSCLPPVYLDFWSVQFLCLSSIAAHSPALLPQFSSVSPARVKKTTSYFGNIAPRSVAATWIRTKWPERWPAGGKRYLSAIMQSLCVANIEMHTGMMQIYCVIVHSLQCLECHINRHPRNIIIIAN